MKYIEETIPIYTRLSETNHSTYIDKGNYLKYIEDARSYLLNRNGLSNILDTSGDHLSLVDINLSFTKNISHNDKIVVRVRLIKSESTSFTFDYSISNLTTHLIVCSGTTTHQIENKEGELYTSLSESYNDWLHAQEWKEPKVK